jgi:hypothetical protein
MKCAGCGLEKVHKHLYRIGRKKYCKRCFDEITSL